MATKTFPSLVMAVLLLGLVGTAPLLGGVGADTGGRQAGYTDHLLYFHGNQTSGDYLDTVPPGPQDAARPRPVTTSATFATRDAFSKDLLVLGHETTGITKGFWLDNLPMNPLLGGTPELTISVTDDDLVVAQYVDSSFTGSNTNWRIPFTGGNVTSHLFPKGHRIGVLITASTSISIAFGPTSVLRVLCDPTTLTAEVTDADGHVGASLQPNGLEADREAIVRGVVQAAFGESDIDSVTVAIDAPGGSNVLNQTATVSGLNYTFNWSYDTGHPAGVYDVTVTTFDPQGNSLSTHTLLTMAEYALIVYSPDDPGASEVHSVTAPGDSVTYSLVVRNTGASPTAVDLTQGNAAPGWSMDFSPATLNPLPGGSEGTISVTVSAETTVVIGDTAILYVQAIAHDDPSSTKASARFQTVTNAVQNINFDLRWEGSSSSVVPVGGTATYNLVLVNNGKLEVNVTLTKTVSTPSWTALLGGGLQEGLGYHLAPGTLQQGTLEVRAPTDASAAPSVTVTITGTSSDTTPTTVKSIVSKTSFATGIQLSTTDPASKEVEAGKSARFSFVLKNPNTEQAQSVSLSASGLPAEWTFILSDATVNLNAGAQKSMTIDVVTPQGAKAGTKGTVTIRAQLSGDPSVSDQLAFSVTISKKEGMTVSVTPEQLNVGPSGGFITVAVKNTGNGDLTVKLVVTNDHSYRVTLDGDDTFTIAPGATVSRKATVSVPTNARDGDRTILKAVVTPTAGSSATAVTKQATVVVSKEFTAQFQDALIGDLGGMIPLALFIGIVILAFFTRRAYRAME